MNGFEAIVRDASDGCGDPPCSAHGTCVEGACVHDAGFFGDFCAMTHCVPQSGVLAGPSRWLRRQAPGETSHQDHRDCFWSLVSSLGPDGQPMIAVDLFFDTLDLEVQSARNDAIPDFFAAGAIHSGGSNIRDIVESGELELISSSTVQRTPEITGSERRIVRDSQSGVGRCVASGSVGTCLCDAADDATQIPAGSEGVWFAIHTDANNPLQTHAGVSLRYEMVWECPRGDRGELLFGF